MQFLLIFVCNGTATSLVFESGTKGRGAILRCAGKLRQELSIPQENEGKFKHRRIHEKTSFTSIDSDRTGSGASKTS